jgi:hypothetical protein
VAEKGMDREALGRLTYTQWEAWLAIGFNKEGARKNLVIVAPAFGVKRGANFRLTTLRARHRPIISHGSRRSISIPRNRSTALTISSRAFSALRSWTPLGKPTRD